MYDIIVNGIIAPIPGSTTLRRNELQRHRNHGWRGPQPDRLCSRALNNCEPEHQHRRAAARCRARFLRGRSARAVAARHGRGGWNLHPGRLAGFVAPDRNHRGWLRDDRRRGGLLAEHA